MYKKVLLKLSGEFLGSEDPLSVEKATELAREIKALRDSGVKVACVVGGGNIFRGRMVEGQGFDSTTPHYVGMLAAQLNTVFLKMILDKMDVPVRLESTLAVPQVTHAYNPAESRAAFEDGEVVITGGTGLPFVSTDTASVIFGLGLGVEALLKGTHVDGVYDSDPNKNPDAQRYETLSYDQALADNLKVMDASAFALAQENSLPIVVFKYEKGSVTKVMADTTIGTVIG